MARKPTLAEYTIAESHAFIKSAFDVLGQRNDPRTERRHTVLVDGVPLADRQNEMHKRDTSFYEKSFSEANAVAHLAVNLEIDREGLRDHGRAARSRRHSAANRSIGERIATRTGAILLNPSTNARDRNRDRSMTKLETFREAAAAVQAAPTEKYGATVNAMHAAFDDWKMEPDAVAQAEKLVNDPSAMVRYMVAVLIRPTQRERADAMFQAIADEDGGIASTWAKF